LPTWYQEFGGSKFSETFVIVKNISNAIVNSIFFYKNVSIFVTMFGNKPAVWCQCASVLTTTLALSSIFSVQHITWQHGFYPNRMTRISSLWSGLVYLLIVTGNAGMVSYMGSIVGLLLGTIVPQQSYLILVVGLVQSPSFFSVLLLSTLAVKYQYYAYLRMAVGKTMVDAPLKQATAAKAVGIVSKTLLLWYLRCHYRFPHVYRWFPVLCSACAVLCAVCWCHCFIAPTIVSHRSVVKAVGHGLTPSLNAAKGCPVCSSCLTHLDIEDVFD
jgi:hypothetical protein